MPTRITLSIFRCRWPSRSATLDFRPLIHDASHFSATRCGGSSGGSSGGTGGGTGGGGSGSCSLSSAFAAWFWKTCIAVSLVPPTYVVYLLKRRFWDDRPPPSSLDSVSPRLDHGDAVGAVGVSAARGTFHIQVIGECESGGGGYQPHRRQPVGPVNRESGEATANTDQHERFLKLKSTLEMLNDAGLLRELEERWQEREVERMQQRVAMKERKMKELRSRR